MKFRVKNIKTNNFVTSEISNLEAQKWCNRLNETQPGMFRIAAVGEDVKLSSDKRAMTKDELSAIAQLKEITYASGLGHNTFVNTLLYSVETGERMISDKQAAYMWYLVHRYRRQIKDGRIVLLSKQNKVY